MKKSGKSTFTTIIAPFPPSAAALGLSCIKYNDLRLVPGTGDGSFHENVNHFYFYETAPAAQLVRREPTHRKLRRGSVRGLFQAGACIVFKPTTSRNMYYRINNVYQKPSIRLVIRIVQNIAFASLAPAGLD
jgi:hypothetical protein